MPRLTFDCVYHLLAQIATKYNIEHMMVVTSTCNKGLGFTADSRMDSDWEPPPWIIHMSKWGSSDKYQGIETYNVSDTHGFLLPAKVRTH